MLVILNARKGTGITLRGEKNELHKINTSHKRNRKRKQRKTSHRATRINFPRVKHRGFKMNCPKCNKGVLREQILLKGFFKKKKSIKVYCNLCDFENEHIFNLSKRDLIFEEQKRNSLIDIEKIKTSNTINKNKNENHNKTYNQIYKREGLSEGLK